MVLLLLLFIEWRERQSFYPHLSFTHSYPLGAFQGHQGVTLFWQVTVNLSSPLSPYENVTLMLSYDFFSCLLSSLHNFLDLIEYYLLFISFLIQFFLCARLLPEHHAPTHDTSSHKPPSYPWRPAPLGPRQSADAYNLFCLGLCQHSLEKTGKWITTAPSHPHHWRNRMGK